VLLTLVKDGLNRRPSRTKLPAFASQVRGAFCTVNLFIMQPTSTTPAFHSVLASALFERAVRAHAEGDSALRNSLCFWVQFLDHPQTTPETAAKYVQGLKKSGSSSPVGGAVALILANAIENACAAR